MRKFSRKSIVIASSTALVLATSAVALAFWTGVGAGTGNAQTGSSPSQALIVHQDGTPGGWSQVVLLQTFPARSRTPTVVACS